MLRINHRSERILSILVSNLTPASTHRRIQHSTVYMPVVVEQIGPNLFAVAHYGEQHGDLMADPEMVFWRDGLGHFYAASYRNDYVGLNQESIVFGPDTRPQSVRRRRQADHTRFANQWLANVNAQQAILERAKRANRAARACPQPIVTIQHEASRSAWHPGAWTGD